MKRRGRRDYYDHEYGTTSSVTKTDDGPTPDTSSELGFSWKGFHVSVADADLTASLPLPLPPSETKQEEDHEMKAEEPIEPEQVPLEDEFYEGIVARLPDFGEEEVKEFHLRESSLKVPRSGKTIKLPFPPGDYNINPPQTVSGQMEEEEEEEKPGLKVEWVTPIDDSKLDSFHVPIQIHFTHPMVPIDSVSDDPGPIVRIKPKIKGKWSWVDTQTVKFVPNKLSGSTSYKVVVPKDTESCVGTTLKRKFEWSFRSPLVKALNYGPVKVQGRNPVLWVYFNQSVSAADVIPFIKINRVRWLLHTRAQEYGIREATEEEVEKEEDIQKEIERVKADTNKSIHNLIFITTTSPLDPNNDYYITFMPNMPSLEGPLKLDKEHHFKFSVYCPLKQKNKFSGNCTVDSPVRWNLTFNNPIIYDENCFKVEPKLNDQEIELTYENTVTIVGRTSKEKTKYKITISDVVDKFEQTLHEQILYMKSTRDKQLYGTLRLGYEDKNSYITLDPYASSVEGPVFSCISCDVRNVRVIVYSTSPKDFDEYQSECKYYAKEPYSCFQKKKVCDKVFAVEELKRQMEETEDSKAGDILDIELSEYFKKGHKLQYPKKSLPKDKTPYGHLVVYIASVDETSKWSHPWVKTWISYTNLGVDAIPVVGGCVVHVSELETGKPLKNCELSARYIVSEENSCYKEVYPQGKTDKQGIVLFEEKNEPKKDEKRSFSRIDFLLSYSADGIEDSIFVKLPQSCSSAKNHVWHVFDDRKMYKPGEEVSIKGWFRYNNTSWSNGEVSTDNELNWEHLFPMLSKPEPTSESDLKEAREYLAAEEEESEGEHDSDSDEDIYKDLLLVTASDCFGNDFWKDYIPIDENGGFCFFFKLPDNVNLGNGSVMFKIGDTLYIHYFEIQEFRKPEFKITANLMSMPPFYVTPPPLCVTLHEIEEWEKKAVEAMKQNKIRAEEKRLKEQEAEEQEGKGKEKSEEKTEKKETGTEHKEIEEDSVTFEYVSGWKQMEKDPHFDPKNIQYSKAIVKCKASYFTGTGLDNSAVTWEVRHTPGSMYIPPNLPHGFVVDAYRFCDKRYTSTTITTLTKSFSSLTKSDGSHQCSINFIGHPSPTKVISVSAEATVQDLNNQALVAKDSFVIHPSKLYVALKASDSFVDVGNEVKLGIFVTDIDGIEVQENVDVWVKVVERYSNLFGRKQTNKHYFTVNYQADLDEDHFISSFRLVPENDGAEFKITCVVRDDEARQNKASIGVQVSGGWRKTNVKSTDPVLSFVTADELRVELNKEEYMLGDTAHVLISTPFSPCEGTLSIVKDGATMSVIKFNIEGPPDSFTAKDKKKKGKKKKKEKEKEEKEEEKQYGSSKIIKLDIKEIYMPGVSLHAFVVGSKNREYSTFAKAPALASATVPLKISRNTQKIFLTAIPQSDIVQPGAKTEIKVRAEDSEENGLECEVHLIVVDEAILSISGHSLTDPLDTFFKLNATNDIYHTENRTSVLLRNLPKFLDIAKVEGADLEEQDEDSTEDVEECEMCFDAKEELYEAGGAMFKGRASRKKKSAAPRTRGLFRNMKKECEHSCWMDDEEQQGPDISISLRADFNPLCVFQSQKTDQSGHVVFSFNVKDNLTSYR